MCPEYNVVVGGGDYVYVYVPMYTSTVSRLQVVSRWQHIRNTRMQSKFVIF